MTRMRKGDTYMSMRKFYRNTAACLLAALFLAAAGCSSTTSVFPSAEGSEEELAESGAGREDASGTPGSGRFGDETEESTAGMPDSREIPEMRRKRVRPGMPDSREVPETGR